MKKQIVYSLVIIIAAIGLVIYFRNKTTNASTARSAKEEIQNSVVSANTSTGHLVAASGGLPSGSQVRPSVLKQERLAALSAALTEYTKQTPQPIEFYGKVVDENMQPVNGVGVSFNYNTFRPEASFSASAISDSMGLFSISGVKGITLSVSVGKQGYYSLIHSNQTQFVYLTPPGSTPFQPDQNNPVIFYLRKKGAGVDLITSKYGMSPYLTINAPKDGTPVWVDLLNRKSGAGGQLEIQSWLDVDLNTHRTKSWRLKLNIPDGGFVEMQDEFPFMAPEDGYQTELTFPIPDEKGNVRFGLSQKIYYVTFGNPRRYGHLEVNASDQTGEVWFQYAINPDGSRNLEPKQ